MNHKAKYFLPVILILVFIFWYSQKPRTEALYADLKCPEEYTDNFSDYGERWEDWYKFTDDFFRNHPDATLEDLGKERRRFYDIKGCTEAIERYESYGN